jgi:predicted nucleic acid-binding protein
MSTPRVHGARSSDKTPSDFFDTNVILYLLSADSAKADRAEALLAGGGAVSVQVLNEFVSVGRRKGSLDWSAIDEVLGVVRAVCTVQALTVETHETGLRLARRLQLSIYDAMIVSAALQCGCRTLWSEDMHDGLLIDNSLRIRNPFA